MKKKQLSFGKKKNTLFSTLVWITALACVTTSILIGCFIYTQVSISKYENNIQALSDEVQDMQKVTHEALNRQEKYKKKLELLKLELAQYESLIIPDSMKKK